VILDWVPNHTGWDHVWLKQHPEFYTHNEKGEIVDPINPETGKSWGWTDVADLNYDNKGLREAMSGDMMHWIKNENIDGFRCDVAGNVPTDFWEETIPKLRKEKNIFMLAEAWQPELLKSNLFDMCYGWETHHIMNRIAKGENTVSNWDKNILDNSKKYEANDIAMNFVDNHDENSWNGTMKSRLGNAEETMTALSYLTPGMPLVYSGDEYGLDKSLKFFEKDSFTKIKGKQWEWRVKLGKLKNENKALNGGKKAASCTRILTSDDSKILAFARAKEKNKVIFVGNLSKTNTTFTSAFEGKFTDYMTGEKVNYSKNQKLNFNPWEYKILIAD
jgi:glycosidase